MYIKLWGKLASTFGKITHGLTEIISNLALVTGSIPHGPAESLWAPAWLHVSACIPLPGGHITCPIRFGHICLGFRWSWTFLWILNGQLKMQMHCGHPMFLYCAFVEGWLTSWVVYLRSKTLDMVNGILWGQGWAACCLRIALAWVHFLMGKQYSLLELLGIGFLWKSNNKCIF